MLIKSCSARVKAVSDSGADAGQFQALVSVFGNVDSYGDVVMKGAFEQTLADWAAKGDPIPVYWSHRMDDPNFNIGEVLEAKETDEGLWVKAQIDLEAPTAAQVFRLLKSRRVTQFSFAYDVEAGGWAKSEELGDYYELRQLKLYEVGPTPIGANQETDLLDVKSIEHLARGMKAGRTLSAKNETTLRTAYEAIGTVLSTLDPDASGEASGTGKVKNEDPAGSSSRSRTPSPSAKSPASLDAAALLALELELA